MNDIEFLPLRWWAALKREWMIYHLGLPEFRFMFDQAPPNEWVSLDCETTGLNVSKDEIISIGAVRIVGNRIMTSERLELLVKPEHGVSAESVKIHRMREQDVAQGLSIDEAMKQLMRFIGSRPLVVYFLEFDVAMINKAWDLSNLVRECVKTEGREVPIQEAVETYFLPSGLIDIDKTNKESGSPPKVFFTNPYGLQYRPEYKDWIPFRHGAI